MKTPEAERLCIACRTMRPRSELMRLTVDYQTGSVGLNSQEVSLKSPVMGRSAYICFSVQCVEQALKGHRLKGALEGRKKKGTPNKRSIQWPLEPQLIKDMSRLCTERPQTCKNTQRKEVAG